MKYLIANFIGLLLTLPVAAQDRAPGWAAFAAGHYEEAAETGKASKTPDGYALACRAHLVLGGYIEKDSRAITTHLHAAITACLNALELDPKQFEARLSLATAVGHEGKRLKKATYPKISKMILDSLVEDHPDSATALAARAAWHSEISAAGLLARIYFKTNRKNAETAFEKALETGELEFALMLEYIKYLARGNREDREKARSLLPKLYILPRPLAQDALLLDQCEAFLGAVSNGEKRAIKQTIEYCAAFSGAGKEKGAFPMEKLHAMIEE